MKYILSITFVALFLSGCLKNTSFNEPQTYKEKVIQKVRNSDYNQPYAKTDSIYQNLNGAIISIADQLFTSDTFSEKKAPSIILTSFVNLNNLERTSTFGRVLSESMFNELHIRHFKVTDFRGQDAVSVNANGEFHITRDVDKLKDHISATEFILVGTYVKFENNSVLLNARILDSQSGAVISTARVIYTPKDCKLYNLCPIRDADIKPADFGINVVKDKCSGDNCPAKKCKDGICDKSALY